MRRAGLLLVLALAGCGSDETVKGPPPSAPARIHLTSSALRPGAAIPKRFTCDGANVSPPLSWSRVPKGSKGLALLVTDPDAPGGTFVHWVVVRLRTSVRSLPEGRVPPPARATRQSSGKVGYGGPCPPEGDKPHHYVFSLYALKRPLRLPAHTTPAVAVDDIRRAAIARGTLTGTYGR